MSERSRSQDLTSGTVVAHQNGHRVVLTERKSPDDPRDSGLPYLPGWWVAGGGGLADFVVDAEDSEWRIVSRQPSGEVGNQK